MADVIAVLVSFTLLMRLAIAPLCAGGGKTQHENVVPGPGNDAQGNQAD